MCKDSWPCGAENITVQAGSFRNRLWSKTHRSRAIIRLPAGAQMADLIEGNRILKARRHRVTARLTAALATLAVLLSLAAPAAQRRRFFYGWDETVRNVPYDARFTFVRVRYRPTPGGYWAGGMPSWVHGYPLAEQNLMKIMKEISLLDAHVDDINVITLDDPQLF